MGKATIISEQGAGAYRIQPQVDTAAVQARMDALNEKIKLLKGEGIYWGAVESLPVMASRVAEKLSLYNTAMEALNTAIQVFADGREHNIPLEDHASEVQAAIDAVNSEIAKTTDPVYLEQLRDDLKALTYENGCPSEESQLSLWEDVVSVEHELEALQAAASVRLQEAEAAHEAYVAAQAAYATGDLTEEELLAAEAAWQDASNLLALADLAVINKQAQKDAMVADIHCESVVDMATALADMEKKDKAAQTARNDYEEEKALYNIQALKVTSLEKTVEQLNLSISQGQALVDTWCADYTEGLTGEVGTLEINGDDNQILVLPGYNGGSAYNGTRDGILQPTKLMTPAQAFANYARMPGWQKWKPTYRLGTITAIEGDTCSVQLDEAVSTRQSININQADSMDGVTIDYLSCNGVAFQAGDRVVIEFSGMDWSNRKVIGFESNPKQCPNNFLFMFETEDHTYQYKFNPITFKFEHLATFEKTLGMSPQEGFYPYSSAHQYAKVISTDYQSLFWVQSYGNTLSTDVYSRITCLSCDCVHNSNFTWSIISSPLDETVVIRMVNKTTLQQSFDFTLHGGLNSSMTIRSGKITAMESEPGNYLLERILTYNTTYSGLYQRYKVNGTTGVLSFLSYDEFSYDGTALDLNWYIQSFMGSNYRLFDVLDVFGTVDWTPAGYSATLSDWTTQWDGSNPCTLEQFLPEHRNMSFFGVAGSYETLLIDQYVPRDPAHLVRDGWDRHSSDFRGPVDYSNNITFAAGGLSAFSPLWPIPGYIEGGEIVDIVETYNEYPDGYDGEVPWSCPPPAAATSELTEKTGTHTQYSRIKLPFFGDIELQNGTATYNGPILPGGPDVTYSSTNGSGWPFFSLAVGSTVALLAIHWTENDPVNYPELVQFFRKVISTGQDWSEAEWVNISENIAFPPSLGTSNFMGLFMH